VNSGNVYVNLAPSSVILHPVIVTGDAPEFVIFTHSSSRSRPLICTSDGVGDGIGVGVGDEVGVTVEVVVRVGAGVGVRVGIEVGVGVEVGV